MGATYLAGGGACGKITRMPIELQSRSIQFLSRPHSHPDDNMAWAGKTADGRDINVSGKLRIGTPLFYGAGARFGQRAMFAPPWAEYPSIGAVQYVDPYAEQRWPSYLMLEARLDLPNHDYSTAAARDIAQYMRGIVGWGLFNNAPFASLQDQTVIVPGYRWGYWTSQLDFVKNPAPNPHGGYAYSEPGEGVGPGFVALDNMGFPRINAPVQTSGEGMPDLSHLWEYLAQFSIALVWSQSLSLPHRSTLAADHDRIQKRVQEVKRHWNSYNELKDAEGHLARYDLKGTVRSAASSVDAALRFYCPEWSVTFPTESIPFNGKIEQILAAANRPSYSLANPSGSTALLHLYRARNAMHEGDNYFKHEHTGQQVQVDQNVANEFLSEAKAFLLWLDSQA